MTQKKKMTQKTKDKLSVARKKYLSENKNKHNWSAYHGKQTYPEKMFQQTLIECGVTAVQYYIPPENDRLFELDFCLPNLKIGWEINGNQHYESDHRTLKSYYQERHDYFVAKGWIIHEIHYSEVYVQNRFKEIINNSLRKTNYIYVQSPEIVNFRLKRNHQITETCKKYIIKTDNYLCADMDKYSNILSRSSNSRYYYYLANGASIRIFKLENFDRTDKRKVSRPSKEELLKLIWEEPTSTLAKRYGVSDVAISKWCLKYGIAKPPRGYWAKNNK